MKKIQVNTGFGYFKNSEGIIIAKAELPKGEHNCQDMFNYVEVATKAELDALKVEPPKLTEKEKTERKIRKEMRKLAIKSLKGKNELPTDFPEE